MLSTMEGELPRTRGPNPLFWTHTLAHLSLAPQPPATQPLAASRSSRIPLSYLLPPFLPSTVLLPSPTADTAHCPECCVVASPASLFSSSSRPRPVLCSFHRPSPPPLVLRVQFCITIRRALRKLPRNFSLLPSLRALDRPFQPPTGQLGEPVRLTLFLCSCAHHSSRANAIHRSCFFARRRSSLSYRHRCAPQCPCSRNTAIRNQRRDRSARFLIYE